MRPEPDFPLSRIQYQRRWREIRFPAMLLVVAAGIHMIHRPWWMYYYLHLAIPLAWFAAIALAPVLSMAWSIMGSKHTSREERLSLRAAVFSSLAALVLLRSGQRIYGGIRYTQGLTLAKDSAIVSVMKHHAPHTKWAFAQREIYAFHAGLMVPPELAVTSLKRFWAQQISPEEITFLSDKYPPEQILIDETQVRFEWGLLEKTDYIEVLSQGQLRLFVRATKIRQGVEHRLLPGQRKSQ